MKPIFSIILIYSLYLLISLISLTSSAYVNKAILQKRARELYKLQKKKGKNKARRMQVGVKKGSSRRMQTTTTTNTTTSYEFVRCDQGHEPDDLDDCTKYSTDDSSCCKFKYGADTGCIYVPFRYLGAKTVGDMTVTCGGTFYKNILFLVLGLCLIIF